MNLFHLIILNLKKNIKYSIGSQVLFYILPLSNKLNPKEIFIYSINLANTLQVPIEKIFYYRFEFLVRDVRIIYFKTKKDREYSFIYESISEYIFKTRGL